MGTDHPSTPHRIGGGETAGHFFNTIATEFGPLGEMFEVGKHGPTLRIQICPEILGFSPEKGISLIIHPIVRMGLRPSILLDREGSGFLGL